MQTETLFGHLVTRFSTQPENLATESLSYIINRSNTAKRAFLRYLSQVTVELPENLRFQTQASGEDSAIPDLVGIDVDGDQVFLIEAKFWAGLTDNQPITYLKRLPENKNGILLFIAPALRFQTLWPELLRRCGNGAIVFKQEKAISDELNVVHLTANHILTLVSWRSVLSVILQELDATRETKMYN